MSAVAGAGGLGWSLASQAQPAQPGPPSQPQPIAAPAPAVSRPSPIATQPPSDAPAAAPHPDAQAPQRRNQAGARANQPRQAQVGGDSSASASNTGPSPSSKQNFAFELRLGPHRPEVDSQVAGSPFSEFFGGRRRYQFGLELDWQALRIPFIGSLGLGAGWGYARRTGVNRAEDGGGDNTVPILQKSSFRVMPLRAVGVLRIDGLAREVAIPLVPYAKAGLGVTLWWVNDGRGVATNDLGVRGKDISTGFVWSAGLMLLLDTFDPGSARQLETATGLDNTYLFAEWMSSRVGDSASQMYLGSNDWVAGLAFEF